MSDNMTAVVTDSELEGASSNRARGSVGGGVGGAHHFPRAVDCGVELSAGGLVAVLLVGLRQPAAGEFILDDDLWAHINLRGLIGCARLPRGATWNEVGEEPYRRTHPAIQQCRLLYTLLRLSISATHRCLLSPSCHRTCAPWPSARTPDPKRLRQVRDELVSCT